MHTWQTAIAVTLGERRGTPLTGRLSRQTNCYLQQWAIQSSQLTQFVGLWTVGGKPEQRKPMQLPGEHANPDTERLRLAGRFEVAVR